MGRFRNSLAALIAAGALLAQAAIADDRVEVEQYFEPFVQASSGQQSQEGTGLGLAISFSIIVNSST